MKSKTSARTLALVALLVCQPGSAQMDSWMSDRDLANYLTRNGVAVSTERASLWFDSGALEPEQMDAFAKLVNRGIIDIEAYLGVSRAGGRRIRYFISNRVEISHSTWRSIFLPLSKVQNRTAPYLHETVHQVAPCDDCPMWFNEGLASFVQSYVSEHTGGYDGAIFSERGNRGIDQDARRWLASDRGQVVLPFIGVPGEPPDINYDRSNVAAPFYVMAQSLVKFIVQRAKLEKLRPVFEAKDFEAALTSSTGKSSAEWKKKWLAKVNK
ncbi:MAG: hypothetical protein ABSE86_09020 [Bryobacteraceae bacterium]|jgi:hypothetical protein